MWCDSECGTPQSTLNCTHSQPTIATRGKIHLPIIRPWQGGHNSFDHATVTRGKFVLSIRNGLRPFFLCHCVWAMTNCETYPAFSSSSSFEPDAVFVGRSSSGRILDPLLLLSSVVSASFLVWATFSITLPVTPPPPVVRSDRCGLRAALCFRARLRRAWWFLQKRNYYIVLWGGGRSVQG